MVELRYWDSDAFLGWLNEEEDKVEECRGVLESAEKGDILLVTSALTLAEVIKLKGRDQIDKENAETVKAFFKQKYISVRNVDRATAEYAQELLWDYAALKPKDSIHVATAIKCKVPLLNTFDGVLLNLNGAIGNPPLIIVRPSVEQSRLPFINPNG